MRRNRHIASWRIVTDQRGVTLLEGLVVVMIIAMIAGIAGVFGSSWLRHEQLRSAVYEAYVQASLARVEAVNRNRDCRFVIDTSNRTMRVFDMNNTATGADDVELAFAVLDGAIDLALPGGGTAVTLDAISGTQFEAVFSDDGTLTSGVGSIGMQSGEDFRRISIFAGGGIAVERWDGSNWITGW